MQSTTSGTAGLEMLRQQLQRCCCLMSNACMSGWDVLAEIRKDEKLKGLVVIALTAHAMAGDKEKALEAGFDGYMTKPITRTTFINDIKAVLEMRNIA